MSRVNFPNSKKITIPLLSLGFRPFFLGAGLFAAVSIALWFFAYTSDVDLPLRHISIYQWHAHEMIYGYSLAVIAGFLLAATKNWTGIQTVHGVQLFCLVALWLAARVLLTSGMTLLAGVFDLLFLMLLNMAIIVPVIKSRQWQQLAVVSKLLFFLIGNSLFYLGALGIVENGIYLGLYGGLYLVIGLIMMMGRRVIPFFIEKGVDKPVHLHHSKLADLASLVFFLVFFVTELIQSNPLIPAYSALLLGIVNIIRLVGWYTHELWKKPLLWSLYLAMCFISAGFCLFYLTYFLDVPKSISIHTFSYGGIGMITLGMMARVALGHTEGNVHRPPTSMKIALIILLLGVIFRVLFVSLFPEFYLSWITVAAVCWITAFLIFFCQYYPILTK